MKIKYLATILFLASCSFNSPGYEIEREPSKYEVEVDTIDKLALQAVDEAKTDFFVPITDDMAAWDRTKIFFVKYLDVPELKYAIQKSNKTTIVTNSFRKDSKYIYQVRKEFFGNGYNYFVDCKPADGRTSQTQATRNAKNLSRFIYEGTLETTLLR